MTDDLRTRMHHVADEVTPLPVADDLWRRGQAARHRGQALVVAAVLMVLASVGGGVALWSGPDREARTASTEVPEGGAIPSRIEDPGDLGPTTDLAVGRVSVAFVGSGRQPVVVTATDGRPHALTLTGWDQDLLSLSPDGTSLAWTIETDAEGRPREGLALADLTSGETRLLSSGSPGSITPQEIAWSPSSRWLTWFADDTVSRAPVDPGGRLAQETSMVGKQVEWAAIDDEGTVTFYAQGPRQWQRDGAYGRMRMSAGTTFDAGRRGRNHAASASPDGESVALASDGDAVAVDFLTGGRFVERDLARDLYPRGAAVRPLGWATDTLVVARLDGPDGSYVEGPHLALLTAPTLPESRWTYRILVRDIQVTDLSVAVDLIPDLDGTSSQELTHDFGHPTDDTPAPLGIELSLFIGLGVAAAIALLLALRWLWRRLA
jgi:hypothetical protein